MTHKILYFTLDGDTTRAREILDGWGTGDQFELVGKAHAPFAVPEPADFAGCEGCILEFSGVPTACAQAMGEAGVRVVSSMSIGMNHVDVATLRAAGVEVANCPGYCAEDVATHTVALMLDLMRKTTFANRHVLAGEWDPKGGYPIHRTQGATLGLVFFGRIAQQVAPIAQALGMRVVVWAPTKSAEVLAAAGCEKAETVDELLACADVASLHCPLIPLTDGLIGARELELMKPTAYLVNTARGQLVDEEALADALDANIESGGERGIRAAALDVLCDETHPNRRLIEHPRCIVTPHAAYDSLEAADNLRVMSLEAMKEVLIDGATPRNAYPHAR